MFHKRRDFSFFHLLFLIIPLLGLLLSPKPLQAGESHVSDPHHFLSQETIQRLDTQISEMSRLKNIQAHVFVLNTDAPIQVLANSCFSQWKRKNIFDTAKTGFLVMNLFSKEAAILVNEDLSQNPVLSERLDVIRDNIVLPALFNHQVNRAAFEGVLALKMVLAPNGVPKTGFEGFLYDYAWFWLPCLKWAMCFAIAAVFWITIHKNFRSRPHWEELFTNESKKLES